MFFAVAGSAFIVRARMAHGDVDGCPYGARHALRRPAELRPAPAATTPIDCEATTRTTPDGTQLVEFRVCPE